MHARGETMATEVRILLENTEQPVDAKQLGVTIDSTPEEILKAVQPYALEQFGVNIQGDGDQFIYTVRKSVEKETIFIVPKTTAGY
jgi:hypothetical protein